MPVNHPPPAVENFRGTSDILSVPKSGDDGVFKIASGRANVHQHISGVVAAASPRPHSDVDRESRPVRRTGDTPNEVGCLQKLVVTRA